MIRILVAAVVVVGLGAAAASRPMQAFFGAFTARCRDVRVYDGGASMTGWCRRVDGSWRFTHIVNCGGGGQKGVGHPRCGI